ncbi:MAG: 50S ribosomal protein L11 methyltransferase [Nocardiopsaceae bacterium]|nr:50S ribosomal protein L11 methyltransferase [Nocardiopsaceae bacterium]
MSAVQEPLAVIQAGTQLMPVPLVPEIRLHLASEPVALWEQTERDLGRAGLEPPYWGFAWAGGQALARYLLDRPALVAGRRVIDLASGSGLVAIAAARAGAATVAAYDVDPVAVAAIGLNAAANGVAVSAIRADILDADPPLAGPPGSEPPPAGPPPGGPPPGEPPAADPPRAGPPGSESPAPGPPPAGLPGGEPPPAGPPAGGAEGGAGLAREAARDAAAALVLAADAWYERELADRLLCFLERARNGGADVLVADPGRAYLPRDRFTRLATYRVPGTGALEDSDTKTASVLAPAW